jgi:hypothetical protein
LNGLSGLNKQMEASRSEIINSVSSGDSKMDAGDLIKLQLKAADFTMKQSLVGKAGEKTGQGAQTLFKGQ